MKIYNVSKIINISEDGIQYLDKHKKIRFLNFQECYNNCKLLNKRKKLFDLVYIGQRNIDECYIEFFTKPFIRFEMKNEKEFLKLNKNIMKYGWKTIDLS